MTVMPLEAVPEDSMDPTRAATANVAPPAWARAAAASVVAVVASEAAAVAVVEAAAVVAAVADNYCES